MMCGGPRHSPAIRKEASRKGRLFSIMRQSVSAVGQAFDQARRAGKQQHEEEQQQTHEDRADHGGHRDVDQQQNQRKQDGAQRAGHQRAQVGAQARARFLPTHQRHGKDQRGQIDNSDDERRPEERRAHGEHARDPQKCRDHTDEQAGNQRSQVAAAPAITVAVKH